MGEDDRVVNHYAVLKDRLAARRLLNVITMRPVSLLLTIYAALCVDYSAALAADSRSEPAPSVFHIRIDNQAITPVTARFIDRALTEAEMNGADCFVIELNTPGGSLDSTQRIVTRILASRVPVVVYVSPSGGHAASAGLFITLSSHIAAMAPGTRIGAAHPVRIGGLPISPGQDPLKSSDDNKDDDRKDEGKSKTGSPMDDKIVNDTVAWARSLADLRGRNADWAEIAVTKSKVLVTPEAIEQNVVDLEATDLDDLLDKIHGRSVIIQEEEIQISTAGALVHTIEMWWGEKLLAVISTPDVVILLMMFGIYGIMFEMYSPGWGVAGTLGVICLLLAFFGLSVLPVNYVGLALIFVALMMFAAEPFVTSFGALTIGGIICLILGGTMLVDSPGGFLRVSLSVLIPISLATGGITVFLLSQVVQAYRAQVQTGSEGLLGREAVAQDKFEPENGHFYGFVHVHGELWKAESETAVAAGQHVQVKEREGLVLCVEPNESE